MLILFCRKQRREERLSQNQSLNTESQDSDNSATPVNLNRECHRLDDQATTDTNDEETEEWPKSSARAKRGTGWSALESQSQGDDLSKSPGQTSRTLDNGKQRRPFQRQAPVIKYDVASESLDYGASKSDDELLQQEREQEPSTSNSSFVHNLIDVTPDDGDDKSSHVRLDLELPAAQPQVARRYTSPGVPMLGHSSSSEDNLLSYNTAALGDGEYVLPNGMVILSPNGDVFARSPSTGKNILVRPKTFSNFKNFTTNLPKSMKALPLKDNRVKSSLMNRGRPQEKINNDGSITNALDGGEQAKSNTKAKAKLDRLTKEQLFLMWKTSEKELHAQLKKALKEKEDLEQKLASLQGLQDQTETDT